MTTSTTAIGYPVDATPIIAAERARISAALVEEAMSWTGDYRTPVWMAIIGAAGRLGIPLMKEDLYIEAARRREAQGKGPLQ